MVTRKPAKAKRKVAKKTNVTPAIGAFKISNVLQKGILKAAKAQGFTTFGIYVAG